MDDTPILIYKFTYEGCTVIEENYKNLISLLETELEELGIDSAGVKFKLELGVMTRKQIDALPEFDGF